MVKLLFTHSEILLLPTSKRDWLIVFHSSKGEIIQCGNKLFPHRIGQGGGGWAVTAELGGGGGGHRMGDGGGWVGQPVRNGGVMLVSGDT